MLLITVRGRKLSALVVPLAFAIAIALFVVMGTPRAQAQIEGNESVLPAAALDETFTYQGRVTDDQGSGTSGTCSFIFNLYATANGGNPIGSVASANVPVADGYFSVTLNYGSTAFDGEQRFLEIQVDCDGQGYVTLAPRQQLSATPYALHALDASSTQGIQGRDVAPAAPANGQVLKWNGVQWAPAADNAGGSGGITGVDAGVGLLGGGDTGLIPLDVDFGGSGVSEQAAKADHNHDGTYASSGHAHDGRYYTQNNLQTSGQAQVHWDNVTDVPSGQGNAYSAGPGITLNNSTFSADFGGSGSTNQVARSDHSHTGQYQAQYKRTVVVSPVGDGSDASANGAALLAALAGITDASSTNPYLLMIEPGIYDIGSSPLYMKLFVDIEGSGQSATVVRGAGSDTDPGAAVYTANFSEIRMLTVEVQGNGLVDYATGIYADSFSGSRITDVAVYVVDANLQLNGIYSPGSLVELNRVSIRVYDQIASSPSIAGLKIEGSIGRVEDLTIETSGGTFNRGVYNFNAEPTLRNLDIEVFGGTYPRGITVQNTQTYNTNVGLGKGPLILDSSIFSTDTGIYIVNSSPTLRNVNINTDMTGVNVISDDPGSVMNIDRSTIKGVDAIDGTGGYNFEIALTQLDGLIDTNNATFKCYSVYDGNYEGLSGTCLSN